jgi:hypothetical protein
MGLSNSNEVVRLYGGKTAASLLPNWSNADEEYYTECENKINKYKENEKIIIISIN